MMVSTASCKVPKLTSILHEGKPIPKCFFFSSVVLLFDMQHSGVKCQLLSRLPVVYSLDTFILAYLIRRIAPQGGQSILTDNLKNCTKMGPKEYSCEQVTIRYCNLDLEYVCRIMYDSGERRPGQEWDLLNRRTQPQWTSQSRSHSRQSACPT